MTWIAKQLHTALSLHEASDYEAASHTYVEVLQQDGENDEAWHRLGTLMFQAGRPDVALDCLTKAIQFGGASSERYYHVGLLYRARNELERAEAALRQSLQLDANAHRSLKTLGTVLQERGKLDEAAELFRQVLTINPDDRNTRANLGNVLKQQGLLDEALVEYRTVLAEYPGCLETLNKLAELIMTMGHFHEAMVVIYRALERSPGHGPAHDNLVLTQRNCAREVTSQFRAAIEENNSDAETWEKLGGALHIAGQSGLAEQAFRRAVEINPHHPECRSNLIYFSQYQPGITARRMGELYAEWDRWHAQPLKSERPLLNNDPNPDRRLRLGVLSPNLYGHAAAWLTVRGFEHLDRSQFETFFYSDQTTADGTTERIRKTSNHWQDVVELSDREIAAAIHNDGIDILIVMAGHMRIKCQAVASRKPAPVQIAWTGDPSGQTAVDWLIADQFLIPEEFEEFYTESILRMPHDYVTFDPPPIELEIGPTPCVTNGVVTFGSFNQAVKLHSALLEDWSDILQRVPDSRLVLVGQSNSANTDRLLAPFTSAGIVTDRIELHDRIGRDRLLQSYNRVDVCLDTYPFSGGVTTLEALWMGVPVVTMAGETFAGRTSLSHVSNAGLGDLVAETRNEYADIAVRLAQTPERLAHLRRHLRDNLRESPICDGPRFGKDLTAALRRAWQVWAERQSLAN